MYERNREPLIAGDASVVFADHLAEIKRHSTGQTLPLEPETVLRWADATNLSRFATICRRLLLPGSGIRGIDHLTALTRLAGQGQSCLLCLQHRTNIDVPTLYALLEDVGQAAEFERIVWVAGRKLEEDSEMTDVLVRCFNRVIVTPRGWFEASHSEDEIRRAKRINLAAEKSIARMRHQGWVFALFPAGTRIRPDDPSTRNAIVEVHGYLRMFDHLVLGRIDGCTLPVSKDRDFVHEVPRLDRLLYTFGPVLRTGPWLAEAETRYPDLDRKSSTARALTEDLERCQSD